MGHLPELVIAIVGPMGTDLENISGLIKSSLVKSEYKCHPIKVSALIPKMPGYAELTEISKNKVDKRLRAFMKAGTDIRKKYGKGDILSRMVLSSIHSFRIKNFETQKKPATQTAFILNSLKHPAEINLLRDIFKDRLYVISVYRPKIERIRKLAQKIAQSESTSDWHKKESIATELIEWDEKEKDDDKRLGQNASAAFQLGDYFLNQNGKEEEQIDRFFDILFGRPFVTPKIDELYMLQAKSVATMSTDLSRQVGAIIATKGGDVIASGYNEVPCAGGGINWENVSNSDDERDYKKDHDPNALTRDELVEDVFEVLQKNGWLSEENKHKDPSELMKKALYGENPVLKNRRIAQLLEFGRVVHAEMNALSEAARRGISVKNAIMYCTTFPCHSCARHILASGIKTVVYIEPYPKSIAKQLYGDMIQSDGEKGCYKKALSFRAFTGLSPQNFFRFFNKGKRKEPQGKAFQNIRGKYPIEIDLQYKIDDWKEADVIEKLFAFTDQMEVDLESK